MRSNPGPLSLALGPPPVSRMSKTRDVPTMDAVDSPLSVNLYGTGLLDNLLFEVALPWQQEVERAAGSTVELWWLRLGVGGEHLKLRLSVEASQRKGAQSQLEGRFHCFFKSREPATERFIEGRPFEPGDREHHLDGTLFWTLSSPSQAAPLQASLFGSRPLGTDSEWRIALSGALSAGCRFFLTPSFRQFPISFVYRARCWGILLDQMLKTVLVDDADRETYLRYHRDTLIRSLTLGRTKSRPKAASLLERWRKESETPRAKVLNIPAPWAATREDLLKAWRGRVRLVNERLLSLETKPELRIDPFVEGPRYPGLFKMMHGLANAFGINITSEGWMIDHTLRVAAQQSPTRLDGVVMVPGLDPVRVFEARKLAKPEPRFNIDDDYLWLKLIGETGDEGKDFVVRYRRSMGPIANHLRRALGSLRGRKVEEGKHHVDSAYAMWQSLEDQPDLYHLVGRFYCGSRSYYDFIIGDMDAATARLDQAAVEIRQALSLGSYLFPFAPICADVPLKKARLARDQKRWDEMRSHLELLLEVWMDRKPLIRLNDGTQVTHASAAEVVPHLSDEHPELGSSVAYLRRPEVRRREGRYVVEALYRQADSTISLPRKA